MSRLIRFRSLFCLSSTFALGIVLSMPVGAYAACSAGAAPPQKIADFLKSPGSLLTGSELSSNVRDLVVSDPATLPAIIALLNTSPPLSSEVQRAIGTGLGLAANLCIRPDPTFAAEIQTQLAATNSSDAKQQYAAITGNQLIGSVGGGGGGVSGGSSGGQINPIANSFTSGGTSQPFLANSISNLPTNYFGGNAGAGGSTTTGGTTTNSVTTSNITNSVSPSTR